jgi:hypothetical protein
LASVNGNAAFLRSLLPLGEEVPPAPRDLPKRPASEVFPATSLARAVVAAFGWTLSFSAFAGGTKMPCLTIGRHENAFYFNVYARDTTVQIAVRSPLGAPVLDEMETELSGSRAVWHPGKCWHKRCRVFVEQAEDAVISMKIGTAEDFALQEKFTLDGLANATVRVFAPEASLKLLEFVPGAGSSLLTPRLPYAVENTELGPCAVARGVSGFLGVGIMNGEW